MAQKTFKAVIVGASGYTGAELVRLLYHHPSVDIVALVGETSAGKPMDEIYPHFQDAALPKLIHLQEVDWEKADVVFFCLPHGKSQKVIPSLPNNLIIIDLAADFRIYNANKYKEWYGEEHAAPQVQKEAVYGLTEIFRQPIKNARIVACPGCYPTSCLLPLVPLLNSGHVSPDGIIIDAKSGVTGAGRSAKVGTLFAEVNEGIKPYGIAGHRHLAEIEQTLSAAGGAPGIEVTFTPHLVPMSRGILSVIYAKTTLDADFSDIRFVLEQRYGDEQFVSVLPPGKVPSTRDVYGTNKCHINVFKDRIKNRVIIVSAIDNLLKGASGQAVQNFNLMVGLPEATGLTTTAMFP
jgi:N-acetyl-gamma-glutamyl-phosphate reductase